MCATSRATESADRPSSVARKGDPGQGEAGGEADRVGEAESAMKTTTVGGASGRACCDGGGSGPPSTVLASRDRRTKKSQIWGDESHNFPRGGIWVLAPTSAYPNFCARFMSRCLGKAAATVEGERSRPYGAPGQRGARPHDECQSRLTWRYVGTRTRMTNAAAA